MTKTEDKQPSRRERLLRWCAANWTLALTVEFTVVCWPLLAATWLSGNIIFACAYLVYFFGRFVYRGSPPWRPAKRGWY